MCENVYDMIIVGSGPAGLTAGVYGKRAGLKVVILESGFIQGGQIVNTYEVDNYPGLPGIGGLELAEKMKDKESVTVFGMNPPAHECSYRFEMLGFAVLQSLGIRAEEL